WRINAWSEISALAASGIFSTALLFVPSLAGDEQYPLRLLLVLALTTATWIAATFFTAPESTETLQGFYQRVRPPALGWAPVADSAGKEESAQILLTDTKAYVAAVFFVISGLFLIGKWLLGQHLEA